ncbi:MAG: hypothetical protein DMF75_19230 [Acidobacteria bacterium]|nr:MAG: hypothetical protein DMF75_19230 [Acidobacteriota bacterium]
MLIGRFTITFLMRKIAFSTALDPFSLGLFRRGLPCLYLFSDAPSDVQPLASATRERRPHNGFTISRKRRELHLSSSEIEARRLSAASWC